MGKVGKRYEDKASPPGELVMAKGGAALSWGPTLWVLPEVDPSLGSKIGYIISGP